MTLGEKLKLLLKENSMTQEDLAEKLDVSRQAVGKWANDKGMPEVSKLIQISDMFGVSMDYLLKENYDESRDEKTVSSSGYYVSKEMLDGYLLYNRQNVKRITVGICLFISSNVFGDFGYQIGYHNIILSILYWMMMIAGIVLIIWQFFQTKQYQEIKNEHLAFDDKVFEEFSKQREDRRKKYTIMMIAGIVILLASSEIEYLLMMGFGAVVCNVCGWIMDTIWLALVIWAGMSMHIDSIIIKNTKLAPKNNRMKRYRWVYAALPVTAIAVLIGIITNAWSPYAPIIILFCCLLVTTCKLFIESGEKNE